MVRMMGRVIVSLLIVLSWSARWTRGFSEDDRAAQWLRTVNGELARLSSLIASAGWDHDININEETSRNVMNAEADYDRYQKSLVNELIKFDTKAIADPQLRRQIEKMQRYAVNEKVWTEANGDRESFLSDTMRTIFNRHSICALDHGVPMCSRRWQFDPHILDLFANVHDYDTLLYVWTAWRDDIGPLIRPYFTEAITLSNLKARSMNFTDWGSVWRSLYEMDDVEGEFTRLFHQLIPLYEQLHAYVRRRLKSTHANRFTGPAIPAHILGNVMGEEWSNIYHLTRPYPNKDTIDVTGTMRRRGYDQVRLFRLADDFYTSMGLIPAPESFWHRSIFTQLPNKAMVCHPTSWDMYSEGDVRVRMCARITQFDLLIAHHEMGHIQYFLQYANQPFTFKQPANPGFHESIGDTIALAASTRRHMKRIGLLDPHELDDEEVDINWLYKQALYKIPFLVFSYSVDLWRWRVFDGTYTSGNLNGAWWDLMFKLMGLIPPVARNETHFDPAAKSHIVDGTEFARYFTAGILQFQFYQSMCQAAGETFPLHECDFYNSKEAGKRLAGVLRLGSSVHWTVAMKELTGNTRMSAESLLEYFRPLHEWLKKENSRERECYGWGHTWPEDMMKTLPQPRCT